MEKDRLWTRPFIQLSLGAMVLFIGFYLLLPTMPLFVKELGGSEAQVGLAAGLFTLTAVVFRPFVGGLVDRYGRRPFLVGGMLVFTLSMWLYDWVGGVLALLALRMLHGAGWAFSTTAVGTIAADLIPVSRRGEGMGWFGLAMTIAMAVGPMAGVWILEDGSFPRLFLLATALSAASLLLMATTGHPEGQPAEKQPFVIFDKSVLPVTTPLFFLAAAYGGITTYLPLFAESIRVNAGTFFLVYAVVLTLVRPIAGRLSDRYGEGRVIVPSLTLTVVSLIVLTFTDGLAGVILSAVLYGAGFGSAQPAMQAANYRLCPADMRGVASASFMTAFDLGIGFGAIALGLVSEHAGYNALFAVCAASVLVSAALFAAWAVRRLAAEQLGPKITR
jgi:MFS family permease